MIQISKVRRQENDIQSASEDVHSRAKIRVQMTVNIATHLMTHERTVWENDSRHSNTPNDT